MSAETNEYNPEVNGQPFNEFVVTGTGGVFAPWVRSTVSVDTGPEIGCTDPGTEIYARSG
jgi:hypothetical protein